MMRLTFLGTGTSCGVPVLGCTCKVCSSHDSKDKRLRTSALLETASTRILIDCGPDFRQQMMGRPFRPIDAILVTHAHYDHIGGIDDVRPYCKLTDIDVYGNVIAVESMRRMLPYCFPPKDQPKYPGVPEIRLHEVFPLQPFTVGDISVDPVEVMHANLPILGYRFGPLAYITDIKTIASDMEERLRGVDTLVVSALRFTRPHHSHFLINDAIGFARRVGAKHTFLVHACHDIGLHEEVNRQLPPDIRLAYDGQVIELNE